MNQNKPKRSAISAHGWRLIAYDLILLLFVEVMMLVIYPTNPLHPLSPRSVIIQMLISAVVLFGSRLLSGLYRYVWRYVGTTEYIRLMITDALAGALYYILQWILPVQKVTFMRAVVMFCINLLLVIFFRKVYQFLYEYRSRNSKSADLLRRLTRIFTGLKIEPDAPAEKRIRIAIVGAGRVGVGLAEELLRNPAAGYLPCCFIEIDDAKIGRSINGVPVLSEDEATPERLGTFPIQEIIIALPDADNDAKQELYNRFSATGCKMKTYDRPVAQSTEGGKYRLREFNVEELLFRSPISIVSDETRSFYRGKTVLISGGGGSIGSELARQIARMEPRRLVILDVYENSAYDLQQELRNIYHGQLDLAVEIITITDRNELDRVFARHKPDVVLHAAAHKHVPLMETNCCEAIKNNVFGTLNMVETAKAHGVGHFIMISTDKAVNPTNVMGATKRMCEMIVLSHNGGGTQFNCTRFGNVLGSNGSVIPLFRRQIENGGPVTLTDRRIIRYFMTIPEASQLVLTSAAIARRGELFVLDMGKPVRILDLAETMIRLSGYEPYKDIDIVETGLRPGEKLYEELLMRSEELDKTENELIFIEREKPISLETMNEKLQILREAIATNDDEICRAALKRAVPTYHAPEEVNAAIRA